jgi:hypothetical protein
MLFNGGRILVAAVGAIVLVVVAVFLVRSAWWDPASKQEPITPLTGTPPTAMSEPDPPGAPPTPDINTGGTSAGDMGGNPSDGNAGNPSGADGEDPSDGSTGNASDGNAGEPSRAGSTDQPAPYTATTERIQRILGTVAVDVELPQVDGGDPDVAKSFNDEMQTGLQAQADSLTGGTLQDRSPSGVRIGKRVLSGLLVTAATDFSTASSTLLASTVVMDANSGSVITLTALFKDLNKGLTRLQELSKTLLPSTFDSSKLQPTEKTFERWTAESSGMRLYFDKKLIPPDSEGVVDVTIPWDNLADVLKPGVAQIVAS